MGDYRVTFITSYDDECEYVASKVSELPRRYTCSRGLVTATCARLFELTLFDRIGTVLGKFPSLGGAAVEVRNGFCAAHNGSPLSNDFLRVVDWGNVKVQLRNDLVVRPRLRIPQPYT
jgi:hypothetical protein